VWNTFQVFDAREGKGDRSFHMLHMHILHIEKGEQARERHSAKLPEIVGKLRNLKKRHELGGADKEEMSVNRI
jgi:hypothetical protein